MRPDHHAIRNAEMAYELGERIADRYPGIASVRIGALNAYRWSCPCGAKGEPVIQPTREQYDAIRTEMRAHVMPMRKDPDQIKTQPIERKTLQQLAEEWMAEQRRQFGQLENEENNDD